MNDDDIANEDIAANTSLASAPLQAQLELAETLVAADLQHATAPVGAQLELGVAPAVGPANVSSAPVEAELEAGPVDAQAAVAASVEHSDAVDAAQMDVAPAHAFASSVDSADSADSEIPTPPFEVATAVAPVHADVALNAELEVGAAPGQLEAAQVEAAPVSAVGEDVSPAAAEASTAAAVDAPDEKGPPFVLEAWLLDALEAIIFNSSEPLTIARAREVIAAEMASMDDVEGKRVLTHADMKQAFRALLERWSQLSIPQGETPAVRGFRLVEIDGALCFRTAAAQARFIRRMQLGKPQRLSRASLETLAVVAYRQPVTKPQVEEVRGVDCSGALKALLDKKLVRVLGKAEEIGRPLLYGTTKTFLEFFEMRALTDLPSLKELHELEHGIDPSAVIDAGDERPSVIMDLFNADQASAVSEETERESTEAMEALEKALGDAKNVAKRASTLVFGMEVEEPEDGAPTKAAMKGKGGRAKGAAEVSEPPKDEEPKA